MFQEEDYVNPKAMAGGNASLLSGVATISQRKAENLKQNVRLEQERGGGGGGEEALRMSLDTIRMI